nr:uncharacterized protein LOC124809895 [Hydra vulgaris]
MAERRLLQAWIRSQIIVLQAIPTISEFTPSQCSSNSIKVHSASSNNNNCPATTAISFKNLRVDNILSEQTQKHVPICGQILTICGQILTICGQILTICGQILTICGQILINKLKARDPISKAESFTKVCGRYLMNNCIKYYKVTRIL